MTRAKVGVSLYSYGWHIKTRQMTVKEAIDHAASLGVKGIELVDKQHIPNYPHPSAYDLYDLRDYIESYGCKVSQYSTYVDDIIRSGKPGQITSSFEETVKTVLDDIAEAHILGAKVIRPAMAQVSEEFYPLVESVMKTVLPTLQKYGIKWTLEIHAPLKPRLSLEFIKKIDNEYFGLLPDFSAWENPEAWNIGYADDDVRRTVFTFAEVNPVELLEEVMPYSYHVHAKAHHFDEKGEETYIPYDRLVPIISKSLFSGYISAEFEGWQQYEIKDSKKIVETHVELIRRYL